MTHKTDILGALGKADDSAFHLRPGVEVQSPGNLTVDSDWNLYNASRAGSEPGVLTLRAAADLIVKGSISDGFVTAAPTAALGVGESWSYRLTGGLTYPARIHWLLLPHRTVISFLRQTS